MINIIYEVSVASFSLATEVSQNHDNVIIFHKKLQLKEVENYHKSVTKAWQCHKINKIHEGSVASFCVATEVSQNYDNVII